MEDFKVHILGCGSALPTLKHNATSQVIDIRGSLFMVDCGEGTQIQLRRSHIRFQRIRAVFISHLHGDHCLGLIGVISTFGLLGRITPLHIYAPAEYEALLHEEITMFCPHLDYELNFHPVDTLKQSVIYEDRKLTVETIPLEHRVPCCGFLFREKQHLPHIRRDMIDAFNIPVSQINRIKQGAGWTCPDGKVIPHRLLTRPAEPARTYAYCSDTRYMPSLAKVVQGVDLLYHEATYNEENVERARQYYHSTAAQAAMVARDAEAKKLVVGHYSARYENEEAILQEAKAIFPNTILANERLVISI